MKNRFLNIGCGARFNRDWINIDIHPIDESVISIDILNGMPFDNNYFDVVYHSHVFEHIKKSKVQGFLDECIRIIKPGGVMRVVVPDLEKIVKAYLVCLQKAYDGKQGWDANYDWIMLELYDQMVREKSGGEVLDFLKKQNISNIDYIIERWGAEAEAILGSVCTGKDKSTEKLKHKNIKENMTISKINRALKTINIIDTLRQQAGALILGKEYKEYQRYRARSRFQESGELHRWMYDKYSLSKLLSATGFEKVAVLSSHESNIENWNNTGLDTDANGRVYKPDSMFIEAFKPSV